jgi:hypothetical protein
MNLLLRNTRAVAQTIPNSEFAVTRLVVVRPLCRQC